SSPNQLSSYAVLGDVNGETWVAVGDGFSFQAQLVRFNVEDEDPLANGCETCTVSNVHATTSPLVSLGRDPSGRPQMLVVSWSYTDMHLLTFDDGAFLPARNLSTEMTAYVV